ncbi:MAG: efflux RND transporter periplasmic adaptor subunit [Aquificaceae bacterium]
MKPWVKYLIFLLIIFVMVLWLGGYIANKEKPGEVQREKPLVEGIRIGVVEKVSQVETPYTGQVVADKRVEISTRLMGKVKDIYVKEGQMVKAGQPLVVVDAEDIKSQMDAVDSQILQAQEGLRAAIANYEAVSKTYERYLALLKEGAITQQEFDQIKAQFEAAKAQVEQARAGIKALQSQRQAIGNNLKYSNLVSPVEGYVVQKNADPGDLAVPGHPLLVIESPPYLFEVFLPERYVNRIKVGQEYKVYIPSIDRIIEGSVKEVSPSLDPATKTFRVKVLLERVEGLKSGMYGSLLIPESLEALLVPKSALVKRFDFTGVWVVKPDNTLELRFVKPGEMRGDKVEILSGLREGERIVIEGIEKACEGCKVGG